MAATFRLLFKRNVYVELHLWRRFCFELLVVVIILSLVLTNPITQSKLLMDNKIDNDDIKIEANNLTDTRILSDMIETIRLTSKFLLAYAPVTTFTSSVMTGVAKTLDFSEIRGFKNAEDLQNRFDYRNMLAGVQFYDLPDDGPPMNLTIAIRFPPDFRSVNALKLRDLLWVTRCSGAITIQFDHTKDSYIIQDLYIREGFLQIQQQIFKEWFEQIKKVVPTMYEMPDVMAHTVLTKELVRLCALIGSFPLPDYLFHIIYLLSFFNILRNVGHQLEQNDMVHQWHYGYSFTKQWFCLYCVYLIRLMVVSLLIALGCFFIWSHNHGVYRIKILFFMLLFIYLLTTALILTAFLYAKIFSNSINGCLFGAIMWILSYAVFAMVLAQFWKAKTYYVIFILISFFNNLTLFGLRFFSQAVEFGMNTNELAILFGSTITCILIVLLLLVVLQYCRPGKLLSQRIVARRMPKFAEVQPRRLSFKHSPNWFNFEFGDVGSVQVMRLRHVSTMHRQSNSEILKDLSLRLYKGEVFMLLGHIGSGKRTLLRVLCGLKYPVVGNVLINEKDFHADVQTARQLIDFRCDKYGLIPFLTMEQTIRYHVQLKQRSSQVSKEHDEVKKWLDYLDPYVKQRRLQVGKLSPSVRQLVTCCCALASGTHIIAFDEPTKLLTHREAQTFWKIIMQEKSERTFFITTCSIDEAERVADRIGILSRGVLQASGTPFFLRANFSNIVNLVLIKRPHVPNDPITEFLDTFIPGIEPDNEIGDTLLYKINGDLRPKLQRMLIHLENNRNKFGILHVRVVGPDLCDVYMKLVTTERLRHQMLPADTNIFNYAPVLPEHLRKQQMRAVFLKKFMLWKLSLFDLAILIASCILIAVIGGAAKALLVSGAQVKNKQMGFTFSNDVWSTMPDITKCGYLELKTRIKLHWHGMKNIWTLSLRPNSLNCKEGSYMNDLKAGKIVNNNLGAVEMSAKSHSFNAYINQNAFHSAPAVLNVLQNLILRQAYPNDSRVVYRADNYPMPATIYLHVELLDNENAHIYPTMAIGCVLPLIVSLFIIPVAEEEKQQFRRLQLIAGLGLDVYWAVCYLMDLFSMFIYSVLCMIVMLVCDIGNFNFSESLYLVALLTIFGMAALPMTYLLSVYVNSSKPRAFLASLLLQSLTGVFVHTLYWDVFNAAGSIYWVFSMLPGYSLLIAIGNIYTNTLAEAKCKKLCESNGACTPDNIEEVLPKCEHLTYLMWETPGILPTLVFILIMAFFSFLTISWIELRRKENMFYMHQKRARKLRTVTYPFDDADVAYVKMKIASADISSCKQAVVLVDQLEARIPRKGGLLHTVSFALNKYMSLGIYGVRNSGKSHLARQLVGLDPISFGEIYVRGLDFKCDLRKVQEFIGYCPQRGGLHEDMTPYQLIVLLCRIRGVPETSVREKTNYISLMLNMVGWMHRKCRHLTAENRRKVNIALSLVAFNKVMVLDQPTYGMPATTRREIWNALRYMRFCGKTIIFTSNDELECKVLSDFVMVHHESEMLAIGSIAYLCYKYSHGFYVEVRLIREGTTLAESQANLKKDLENLTRFIRFLHANSLVVGQLQNWLKYYVPVDQISYSYLYGAMEKNKVRLNLADYCIYLANMNNIVAQVLETRDWQKQRYTLIQTPEQEFEDIHELTI